MRFPLLLSALLAGFSGLSFTAAPPGNIDTSDLNRLFLAKDSLLYDAIFNHCNWRKVETLLAANFVFYQDQGYTHPTQSQTREIYMQGIRGLCDPKSTGQAPHMRRQLDSGSAQVFLVSRQEVLQTGVQRFYSQAAGEQEQLVEESKFTRSWQLQANGQWKITREMDYLYNTQLNNPPPQSLAVPKQMDPLTAEIVHLDSVLFGAFNAHDMALTRSLYSPDAEFFHDKDGLGLYAQTMDNFAALFARNKNTGLRRELVPGSLQVFPIKDYGAIEIGEHRFCHQENSQPVCGTFKFAVIWRQQAGSWLVTRAVSYGHVDPATQSSDPLYKIILGLDRQLFDAFNAHDLDRLKTSFSPALEFYQDNEGMENYDETVADFNAMFNQQNVTGLRRELIPGTMEVYPLKGYGAIEVGEHRFCHLENGKEDCGNFKFIHIWQLKDNQWMLTRVISYGHR